MITALMSNFASVNANKTFLNPLQKKPLVQGIALALAMATHPVLAEFDVLSSDAYKVFFESENDELSGNASKTSALKVATQCLPEHISPRPLAFFLTPAGKQNVSLPKQMPMSAFDTPNNVHIQADAFLQTDENTYEFLGHTSFWQDGILIFSPAVRANRLQQTAILGDKPTFAQTPNLDSQLDRPVILHQEGFAMVAHQVRLDNLRQQAQIDFAKYQLFPSQNYGTAQQIQINQATQQTQLTDATISACPSSEARGEGKKDWHLEFSDVTIDGKEQRVKGKNAVLKIRDIPVFYSPYFNYPLNDRASGFLFPEFASHNALTSETTIQYVKVPYFFNLAPNYDATLSLMPMTERGLLTDGEFRYLNTSGKQTFKGTVQASYLNDQLATQTGVATIGSNGALNYAAPVADRWRVNVDANQNWGDGFTSQINWHEVSDTSFYSDIPVDNRYTTATELLQNARLHYSQDNLSTYLQVLRYEPLRIERNLYEKRPEVGVNWQPWTSKNWHTSVTAQLTDFIAPNRYVNAQLLPHEGVRSYLSPSLQYRFSNLYSDVKLSTTLHYRNYQLNETQSTDTLNFSKNIPEFKAYGKLRFERRFENFFDQTVNASEFDKLYTQTLEPEVQYVYIPYENQQMLPLFDTAAYSLDFSNLFRANRFSGVDRIGDTHHLAYALNSRIYNADGMELINTGIGQIAYLNDRKVTLGADSLQTDTLSDIYAKANINLGKISMENTFVFDKDSMDRTGTNSRLAWRPSQDRVAYLQYSQIEQDIYAYENLALGGYTPVSHKTQLGIYGRYDLINSRLETSQLALRYQSCCWSVQVAVEQTELTSGLSDNKIQFLFEFTGLSSQNSANNLQKGISDKFYY